MIETEINETVILFNSENLLSSVSSKLPEKQLAIFHQKTVKKIIKICIMPRDRAFLKMLYFLVFTLFKADGFYKQKVNNESSS